MLVRAYAKINLTLDIVGKREDGYHLIDSVFQSVGLYDEISIEKADGVSVLCDGVKESENIALIAAREFFDCTGVPGGARIKISKNIPLLSGLGGGSSDAAAVITALDKLYDTKLSKRELSKIALACGADVPFCIEGGTARVTGIGEKTERLTDIRGFWAVIIKAGEKISTAEMYRRIDSASPRADITGKFVNLIESGEYKKAMRIIDNAFCLVGKSGNVSSALSAEDPLGISLSGSGPSHFAVFPDAPSAQRAAQNLEAKGYKPFCVPFISRANEIIE